MALAAAIAALFGGGEEGFVLDFLATSTTFQERTGASATTPSGTDGPIGTVLDLSGNANHFVAPSDGARPLLRNPSGAVRRANADGVDDFLNCDSISITGNDIYCAVAMQSISVSAFERLISLGDTSGNEDGNSDLRVSALIRASSTAAFRATRNATPVNVAIATGVDGIFEAGYTTSGHYLALDGVDSTISYTKAAFAVSRARIFSHAKTTPDANDYSESFIYRLLLMNRLPSAGERTSIRDWMQNGIDGVPDDEGGGGGGSIPQGRLGISVGIGL